MTTISPRAASARRRSAGPGRPGRFACARVSVALGAALFVLVACKPYRIERHVRPAFYQSASRTELPDQIELEDGTIVEYVDPRSAAPRSNADPDAKPFEIRTEHDDGSVTVRCSLPEHVIANTMTCLRNREYDVMWEQLLARRTRAAYEAEGLGVDDFADFMDAERPEIMKTLNRMSFGFLGQDVVLETGANGAMRARFGPRLSSEFRFTTVQMTMEKDGLKLEMIR